MQGYWKKTNISGEITGLFRVESDGATYRFVKGEWQRNDDVRYDFSWDDDYDRIEKPEALEIMSRMMNYSD